MTNKKTTHNYLTPSEIIEKYPEFAENFNWTARTLGVFLSTKLVRGRYCGNERKSLIIEESLLKLVEHVNELIEQQKCIISDLKK